MFSLVAILIVVAFLLALPLTILLVAWKAGKLIGKAVRQPQIGYAFSAILVLIPVAWVTATLIVFHTACGSVPSPSVRKPIGRQAGLLVDSKAVTDLAMQKWVNVAPLIKARRIDFFEVQTGKNPLQYQRTSSRKSEYVTDNFTERLSSFEYVTTSERLYDALPVYRMIHRVRRIEGQEETARATDLVMGGGLLGLYMRIFGGGQDGEYLSCGYASREKGSWRPSDTSDPQFAQYASADSRFLGAALADVPDTTGSPNR